MTIDQQGWTAEMWIPFTQLRFNEGREQSWGLNIHRWIPSKNEDDYWVVVPRTEDFWASRFGDLRGIRAIDQGRWVEVLPYLTGGSTVRGKTDPENPFVDALNLEGRIGADFKMGVGPNLTLDATVTPDFGQVEVDPAVVNLSDREVIFPERRPFFTEGSGLLNGPTTNYFHSRRIGAAPQGTASGDFVDFPGITTILGAAKLTGRLSSGTSVGVLGAVTGVEHAQTFDLASGTFDEVRVAPRTLYGVVRIQQEFGAAGSTASLIATRVQRDLEPGDPLAALLRRHALMVGGEALLRLGGGAYEVSISGGLTRIDGDKEAILRAQRASERYFQRPDATHVEVDPNRLSMVGGQDNGGGPKDQRYPLALGYFRRLRIPRACSQRRGASGDGRWDNGPGRTDVSGDPTRGTAQKLSFQGRSDLRMELRWRATIHTLELRCRADVEQLLDDTRIDGVQHTRPGSSPHEGRSVGWNGARLVVVDRSRKQLHGPDPVECRLAVRTG